MFDALNQVSSSFSYVLLRVLPSTPYQYIIKNGKMRYMELLVSDYFRAKEILDGEAAIHILNDGLYDSTELMYENGGVEVGNVVTLENEQLWVDIRWLGDGTLPLDVQQRLLGSRVWQTDHYIPKSSLWPHLRSSTKDKRDDCSNPPPGTSTPIISVPVQVVEADVEGGQFHLNIYANQHVPTAVTCFCAAHDLSTPLCDQLLHAALDLYQNVTPSEAPSLDSTALILSKSLKSLNRCGASYVLPYIDDIDGFPYRVKNKTAVRLLTSPKQAVSDYVSCLEAAFDVSIQSSLNITLTTDSYQLVLHYVHDIRAHWIDIIPPGKTTFDLRLDIRQSISSSTINVSPEWIYRLVASAEEVTTPEFTVKRLCASDEMALRHLELYDSPTNSKHLEWIDAHRHVVFTDPRISADSMYINEYSTCCMGLSTFQVPLPNTFLKSSDSQYICDIDFENTNWTLYTGHISRSSENSKGRGTARLPGNSFCSVESQYHPVLKIRTHAVADPEVTYDAASVECYHNSLMNSPTIGLWKPLRGGRLATKYKPHFPRVYYTDPNHRVSGASVCISEYIDGLTLAEHIATKVTTIEDLASLFGAVIDILGMMAEKNVVHRDIKSEHFLVTEVVPNAEYHVTLFDFTWAVSPSVRNQYPVPSTVGYYYRFPLVDSFREAKETFNDVYSTGIVIRELFYMFARMDTSLFDPLIKRMLNVSKNAWSVSDIEELYANLLHVYEHMSSSSDTANKGRYLCKKCEEHSGKSVMVEVSMNSSLVKLSGLHTSATISASDTGIIIANVSSSSALDNVRYEMIRSVMTRLDGWSVLDVGGDELALLSLVCVNQHARSVWVSNEHRIQSGAAPYEEPGVDILTNHLNWNSFRERWHVQNNILNSTMHLSIKVDLVLALNCLHVFTYCSRGGHLAKAVGALAIHASRVLVIEWIDPADPEMIDILASCPTSEGDSVYSLDEFLLVMNTIFDHSVQHLGDVSPTRKIYIGQHVHKRI